MTIKFGLGIKEFKMFTMDALAGSHGWPASASLAVASVIVVCAHSGVNDPIKKWRRLERCLFSVDYSS